MLLRRLAALLCAFLFVLPAAAQHLTHDNPLVPEYLAFESDLSYDSAIPAPADFLGYELGTRFTLHADLVAYIKALAEASDRVTLHEYGATHEGRPLYYMVITSPENHGRIDEIRTNNLRLADPDDAEAAELMGSNPAITWMSYNIHGNEASSTEAAMQVAYRLAAANDANTETILTNSVVVVDPCINPDGRDRYAYWYRSMQSNVLNTNASDLEHDEPWPGGRTNHYWFDLNRDWVWLVHPESQGRIAALQHWMPQVHVDYHEQGYNNNYFTMPGQSPRNLNLPDAYDDWADAFGMANAQAFDENRINYFTREAFDFFYPGYGSSYPSNMGAIGMLTEQGGHSRGGRAVETNDGYVLTLRQRIFDHYTTSIATIQLAADRRAELLDYFRTFFTQDANESATKAYLLPDDEGKGYTHKVIDMLLKHNVEIHRADADFTVRDAHGYWDGKPSEQSYEAGTFIIPTDQARHVFVNTLLQREMAIEDSVMYDMATWSAPLAYNLTGAAWTETAPRVATTRVTETPMAPSGVINPNAQYAYVIEWAQLNAPKALARLWDAGYVVRSARKTFSDGTRTFGYGSLVILMGRNRAKAATAAADMQRIAEEAGVEIVGMDSGRMAEGIDLASGNARVVKKPKVALMVDTPFSSYTAGQLWYLFDHWTEFGINRIRTSDFGGLDLKTYDVLVLPGSGNLSSYLSEAVVERIKTWVREGGTLVGTESSALFLTKDRSGITSVEHVKPPEEPKAKEDEPKPMDPSHYTPYEARSDSSGLRRIPGSALRAMVDHTNPLAYGLGNQLYSLKLSTDALEPSDALQTVGYYDPNANTVLASGYASVENRRKLAGKAFAAVQPMGQGRVVFLVDNTQYRMFWVGPARMMQNAVMLLPGM